MSSVSERPSGANAEPCKRVCSRGEARRVFRGAFETIAALLDFAERGLPPAPPAPGG
jgi:hypothetical protein